MDDVNLDHLGPLEKMTYFAVRLSLISSHPVAEDAEKKIIETKIEIDKAFDQWLKQ